MDEPEVQLTGLKPRQPFSTAHGPGISWLVVIILLILLAFAVMHFGRLDPVTPSVSPTSSEDGMPVAQPRIYTITYDVGVFSPTNLRIHAGDTVRFKNDSIFPIHILSEDLVGFDSVGDVPQGSYFTYTFAARGTFGYRNTHNSDQTGTIIVR